MSGLDRLIAADLVASPHERLVRMSPLRAERVTMALIRASGRSVEDWRSLASGRNPPIHLLREPGVCPVCGHQRFDHGAWWSAAGPNKRANACWHAACVVTWQTWATYGHRASYLARRQDWTCPETGLPLRVTVERDGHVGHYIEALEVDHITPIWRVRAEADQYRWPDVLRFWGLGNLQALTPAGHKLKTKREAAERAAIKRAGA